MKDTVYVSGHRNPDSDSICSAVSYANLKNRLGDYNVIPIRLGNVSRETEFILNYFKVEAPMLVDTVKPQVSDLKIDMVQCIAKDTSLKNAWSIMKETSLKTVPVVNKENKLIGLASQTNITSSYMDIWDSNIINKSNTTLENIVDTLKASVIFHSEDNNKFNGKIVTAAMQPESMGELVSQGDIVICGNREDIQEKILICGGSLIIVTGSHTVSDKIINIAKEKKCTIINTPYDTFTASKLITQSVPVSYIMAKENIITFKLDDLVEDVEEIMLNNRFRSYPVIDSQNRVLGIMSRYHLISHNKKKVILVDHNEKSQSIPGIEEAELLEILDHHRIAAIQTSNPIYFRNQPVGCTATIVASMFFENGIAPTKEIAGLLCGAIISDTLLFKSPTTTKTDIEILAKIAPIAEINPEKFAIEMFKAGSSLEGKTPKDLFYTDFKEFSISGLKIGVSQISTMDTEGFESIRNEMNLLIKDKAKNEGFNLILLMLTNILKGGSELIVAGERKDLVELAYNVKLENNSVYVDGILSRKKQVIPPITNAANKK